MNTFSQIISYIQAAMPELNSGSVASIINKIAEAISQVIDNTTTEMTNTQNIITAIVSTKSYGKTGYYTAAALAYQDGDNLSVDANGNYFYAVIDANKQIIKQAAFEVVISGLNASLILKVAYIDPNTGLLAPLPSDKKIAFDSYFQNFEIPGLPVTKLSNSPNILTFNLNVTYDKTYDFTTLQTNVNAALLTFRNTFTFNGIFHNYYLENYLVANVPGVLAAYVSNTEIDTVPFDGETALSAGYFNYGTTTITYGTV